MECLGTGSFLHAKRVTSSRIIERQTTSQPDHEDGALHALGLTAICFGFFMVILDISVVNVALPAIQHDLHGTLPGLQWVVNGYTLVFVSLLLSAGTLGDRLGHNGQDQSPFPKGKEEFFK